MACPQPHPLFLSPCRGSWVLAWEAGGFEGERELRTPARKTSLALGQARPQLSLAEALPGRAARVCNPMGPDWARLLQPLKASGGHRAACLRARGADMAVKVTPPLPRHPWPHPC